MSLSFGPGLSIGPGMAIGPASTGIVLSGLYAHYDANTIINTTTFPDISGNGRSATMFGNPTTTTVNGRKVLHLNSTSSQYFARTAGYSTDLDSAFTFEMWACPTSADTAGTLIAEWGPTVDGGWQDTQMGFTNVDIRAGVYNTSYAISKASWTANTWYHIVTTYDGAITRTYVDAVAGGTTEGAKSSPSSYGPGYGPTVLSVGKPCADYLGGVTGYFNGYIGAWRIYNRALTSQEVTQNYNATQSIYNPAPDGLTAQTAGTSAWQIKQDHPSSTDGVYWIQNSNINSGNPVQVYCDMTTNGGGWTLIMQNNYGDWDFTNGLLRNQTTPPTTLATGLGGDASANYSIIGWADYIKRSASGFDYMIEAGARGSMGGIWTANSAYSFVEQADMNTTNFGSDPVAGSDGFHQNITEVQIFGTWDYDTNGIEHRMPWYCNDPNNPGYSNVPNAQFTTTHNDGYYAWWGTLMTVSDPNWQPAPWHQPIGNGNPGVIWYWVR